MLWINIEPPFWKLCQIPEPLRFHSSLVSADVLGHIPSEREGTSCRFIKRIECFMELGLASYGWRGAGDLLQADRWGLAS